MENENFEHFLNPIRIIANLAQLFIIDSPKEIDNLCMSVCNGQPPKAQYTSKENKKHKKYESDLKPLWYLE